MTPDQAISPFAPVDSFLGSGAMILGSFGIEYFADKFQHNTLLKAAGYDPESITKKTLSNLPKASGVHMAGIPEPTIDQRLRGRISRAMDYELDPKNPNSYMSKNHGLRKFLTKEVDKPNWLRKTSNFLFKTPEQRARNIALSRESQLLRTSTLIDPKLRMGLNVATQFRTIGMVGIAAGIGQLGFSLAEASLGALASKGRSASNINREAMVNTPFMDSQTAFTTRQRAMQAIQMSQSGYRRAIGNEAAFLHSQM
jgi:hypothetical protein